MIKGIIRCIGFSHRLQPCHLWVSVFIRVHLWFDCTVPDEWSLLRALRVSARA